MRLGRFLLLAGLGVALALLPWPAAVAEGLYLGLFHPLWTTLTVPLVDSSVHSVSALLVLLIVTLPLALLLAGGRRARGAALRFWGSTALALLFLFPLTFGLGYRLPSLEERLGGAGLAVSQEARTRVMGAVVDTLVESANAIAPGSLAGEEAHAAAAACVARYAGAVRGGAEPRLPRRLKLLPPGLLLRFGFAGIASPWLLEPHVDAGLPAASVLAVGLHEFAHTAGFAAEAEAEAVGLLAGMRCDDPRVSYAAALRLARAFSGSLTQAERTAFEAAWPERALADARAARRATELFYQPELAPGLVSAYDLYLRSQGEREGMGEYDRGVALAVALLAAE